MEPLETEYFDCECYSPEHVVRFTYDPDDGELYMSIYLWKWPLLKRIWIAIKYIFGYTSKYGDFDGGASFGLEDLKRLSVLTNRAAARKAEIIEQYRSENVKRNENIEG